MKIFVEPGQIFTEEVKYVFSTLGHNYKIPLQFVSSRDEAQISSGPSSQFDFQIFSDYYQTRSYRFDKDCVIRDHTGKPDYITTIFHMLNSLQEYGDTDPDEVGRYKYSNSYQKKFGNVEENLVGQFAQKVFPEIQQPKSRIFLSHDIDSVNGAVAQDSFHLLKRGNPFPVLKLVMNAALRRPDWMNMDKIMQIEDEHSLKSTFFWLVNKGRINQREINSDYDIDSKPIRKTLQSIEEKGWENGIHKSISNDAYREEISKLDVPVTANRNHYLKFRLPDLYNNIEASGLKMDASLGFAEVMGFRNSYGLPFHPFNMKERTPYSFVEVPLNVMDGTLKQYQGVPLNETASRIIAFLEKNKTGSLISILWHNTYFTDYKFAGYVNVYKKVLEYIRDSGLEGVNSKQIVKEFSWKK